MQLFQRIFDQTPDALVIVDLQGRIVRANDATESMFGYQHDELHGGSIELLIPRRFERSHVAQRAGFAETPQVRRMGSRSNLYARRKDDSEFPADIMISPLETDEGRFILCAVRDISDQKAAEAELRRHQRRALRGEVDRCGDRRGQRAGDASA